MQVIGKKQLRISYGFELAERIMEAVVLINEAVDYATLRNEELGIRNEE